MLAYWLTRCEGFRVRVGGRRGVVRDIELSTTGEAARLVVAFGLGRKAVVPARDVQAVVPAEEVLVIGSPRPRAEAPARAAKPKPAAPRRPSRVAVGARTTARATARAFGRVGRSVGLASANGTRAAGRASSRGARTGWDATARAWRVGGRRKAEATGWLEPRALAAGRRASLAVDRASLRLVSAIAAGLGRIRAALVAAGRAIVSRVSSEPSSGEQAEPDAR